MAKKAAKKTVRRKKKGPSLPARAVSSVGGLIARHPGKIGGPLAFAVVFSFVSANALWYQPGPHPEPMMKTRQLSDPFAVPGRRMAEATEFETFRIEREQDGAPEPEDDLVALLRQVEANPPMPRSGTPGVQTPQPEPETPVAADAVDLLSVQQALAARGYYKGKPDGVTGPLTQAAIKAFQSDNGMAPTGVADGQLVERLDAAPPMPRPRPQTSTDPIADLLSDEPQAAEPEETIIVAGDPMVIEIQRGLVNIAYDGVVVDGVAGETTRTAILEFQKHYRLPETGEPSASVRDKLKEIGAL